MTSKIADHRCRPPLADEVWSVLRQAIFDGVAIPGMSRALSGFAEKQKKGERAKGINKLLWREEEHFFQRVVQRGKMCPNSGIEMAVSHVGVLGLEKGWKMSMMRNLIRKMHSQSEA